MHIASVVIFLNKEKKKLHFGCEYIEVFINLSYCGLYRTQEWFPEKNFLATWHYLNSDFGENGISTYIASTKDGYAGFEMSDLLFLHKNHHFLTEFHKCLIFNLAKSAEK